MDYETKLKELVLGDDRFMVLTAENRAAIRSLPPLLGERFFDTGITEQTMIGAAAGLALRGRVPVCHALATFLTLRAFEFIRSDVGIGKLPVKLVGAVPGFLSDGNGPTHQAVEDVSIMRGIPGMNVFCPADMEDMVQGLETVLNDPAPCYIRYNPRKAVVKHDPAFAMGKAEVLSEGREVALLVYGTLFTEAWAAKTLLEQRGVSVRLVNLRTVKPIDEAAVLAAAREVSLLVTLEDHFLTGGLFSVLAEILLRNRMTCDVLPIALDNAWFKPSLFADVLEYEGFTGPKIADRIFTRLKGH